MYWRNGGFLLVLSPDLNLNARKKTAVLRMLHILIMRHAKSSWDNPRLSDHDRPLNERGQEAARRMGRFLKKQKLLPQLIICSTARRAEETMELLIEAGGFTGPVIRTAGLYGTAAEDYIEAARSGAEGGGRVMIIGHNPACEALCYRLSGKRERFTTATVAHIELPVKHWRDFNKTTTGTLKDIWRPSGVSPSP
jgi:phosphohistidine phosphatase